MSARSRINRNRRKRVHAAETRRHEAQADGTDSIAKLCELVKEAGGTMRLYGQPVDAAQLRAHCERSAVDRIADYAVRADEERAWRHTWGLS